MNQQLGNTSAIVSICIVDLFGHYTYMIPKSKEETADHSRLMILYGDNGSGKTTILKLVYHLLSPEEKKGHRSFIGRTRFNSLQVRLGDGTTVTARRPNKNTEGTYYFSIGTNEGCEHEVEMIVDDEGKAEAPKDQQRHLATILDRLAEANLALFYLSDDRSIEGTTLVSSADEADESTILSMAKFNREVLARLRGAPRENRAFDLDSAINRAVRWIQEQTFTASSRGTANVNTIYSDIVKRIATSPDSNDDIDVSQLDALKGNLQSLSARSAEFSRYGLTPPVDTRELVQILETSPKTTKHIIYTVLEPYVTGVAARLDALQEIHDIIVKFVATVSAFYGDKRVEFDFKEGLRIVSKYDERLDPQMLSRGEKQLLLLLCNTLCSRGQPSVFIIDEPEISLNIKWQRQLIQALLDCVDGSRVQFLMATHSIELIAQHRQHVIRLEPAESKDYLHES